MNKENNNEIFQCLCGKCFNKNTSLTAHKGHCKIYQESIKEQKQQIQQHKESLKLPNGMYKCEYCGKEHNGSYGSGRFCSKQCSKDYISSKNRNAHNPKVKAHLDKLRIEGKVNHPRAPYGTWKCSLCGKIFDTKSKMQTHRCRFCRKRYSPLHKNAPALRYSSEHYLPPAVRTSH